MADNELDAPSHVAYVDDDPEFRRYYSDLLEGHGFRVNLYPDSRTALVAFKAQLPSLVLLDVDMNANRDAGYELCSKIRKLSETVPIIFFSRHGDEIHRVTGFRLDADDYLAKGCSDEFLVVRIRALLRRCGNFLASAGDDRKIEDVSIVGDLWFDNANNVLQWRNAPVGVSLTHAWMVRALIQSPGAVKSIQELMTAAQTVVEPNTIAQHIRTLRSRFEQVDPTFDCIQTVRGRGYRWVVNRE